MDLSVTITPNVITNLSTNDIIIKIENAEDYNIENFEIDLGLGDDDLFDIIDEDNITKILKPTQNLPDAFEDFIKISVSNPKGKTKEFTHNIYTSGQAEVELGKEGLEIFDVKPPLISSLSIPLDISIRGTTLEGEYFEEYLLDYYITVNFDYAHLATIAKSKP